MIKYQLPVLNQEIVDGKVISTKKNITCYLDVSAASQEIWEQVNPKLAETYSLFDYIELVNKQVLNKAKVISILKAVYCFLIFDTPMTLIEFLRMFNLTDENYFNELLSSLKQLFTIVYPDVKKN